MGLEEPASCLGGPQRPWRSTSWISWRRSPRRASSRPPRAARRAPFCDIVGDQLGTMETNEFLNLGQTLIHYATGQNLDFLGEIFGVYRLCQRIASVSQADTNFRFYVAGGGKFGDINSGSDINLPAGTLILSAADNGPIFITDTAYTLKATDTQQYVGAYAAAPGNSANV